MSLGLAGVVLMSWVLGVLYGGYLMESRLSDRSLRELLLD
jgi:hypothetical protein